MVVRSRSFEVRVNTLPEMRAAIVGSGGTGLYRLGSEIAPAVVVPLGIAGAVDIVHAERGEKFARREAEGVGASGACDESRPDMAVGVAVEKAGAWFRPHRQGEPELRPVVAPAHVSK